MKVPYQLAANLNFIRYQHTIPLGSSFTQYVVYATIKGSHFMLHLAFGFHH